MKKKILALSLVAVSLLGFDSMAQSVNAADNNIVTEQTTNGKVGKKMHKPLREKKNPYEGLTLTDAQKTQLEQLDNSRREKRMQAKEARQAEKQQAKESRKAEKQQMKEQCRAARKAEQKEYLEQVRTIVGPDQYVVFLENAYVNGGGNHSGKAFRHGGKDGKKHMADNKSGKQRKDKNFKRK